MYARVASFENRNTSLVGELVSRVRERSRSGQDLPNAKGFLMLFEREGGGSLGITLFESENEIREAEPVFERMGDDVPEELRGRRTSVDVYEVTDQEISEGATAARVSSIEGPPDRVDEAIRHARENVFPKARQVPGWKGYISLVDRRSGRSKIITFWESEDALRASEEQADRLRKEAAEGGGGTITGVERYEVGVMERFAEVTAG